MHSAGAWDICCTILVDELAVTLYFKKLGLFLSGWNQMDYFLAVILAFDTWAVPVVLNGASVSMEKLNAFSFYGCSGG